MYFEIRKKEGKKYVWIMKSEKKKAKGTYELWNQKK